MDFSLSDLSLFQGGMSVDFNKSEIKIAPQARHVLEKIKALT